jgi:outer membrane murein-binding lipoprotein Lpp
MKFNTFLPVIFAILLSGCSTTSLVKIDDVKRLQGYNDQIQTASRTIKTTADKLATDMPQVAPRLQPIQNANQSIFIHSGESGKVLAGLKGQMENIETVRQETATLKGQIKDMEESEYRQAKRIWVWLSALAGLAVTVGVCLAVFGLREIGLLIVVAGILVSAIAFTMVKYAWLFAIAGAGLGITILIWLGFCLWQRRQEFKEVVTSFEIVKTKPEWNDETKSLVNSVQSESTRAEVDRIKKS